MDDPVTPLAASSEVNPMEGAVVVDSASSNAVGGGEAVEESSNANVSSEPAASPLPQAAPIEHASSTIATPTVVAPASEPAPPPAAAPAHAPAPATQSIPINSNFSSSTAANNNSNILPTSTSSAFNGPNSTSKSIVPSTSGFRSGTASSSRQGNRKIIAEDMEWNLCPVEKLTDICLDVLVKNFEQAPMLDGLASKYRSRVLKSIKVDLPLELSAKLIPDEEYWQRAALAQWNICNVSKHGNSWKQLYFENEAKRVIENFIPGKSTLTELLKTLNIAREFIKILDIGQLFPAYRESYLPTDPKADHLDLEMIVKNLSKLEELSVFYGVRNCGMDFSWNYFGMTHNDTIYIFNILRNPACNKTLLKLTIRQSDLDCAKLKIIASALLENQVLQELNLSHNKIGNAGVKALAQVLTRNTSLQRINLSNNGIEAEGAISLAQALLKNRSVTLLDLRLNPLCDEGVIPIFNALRESNATLQELYLSATWATSKLVIPFCEMLRTNKGLKTLDLSSNKFNPDSDGRLLLDALRENHTLEKVDLRYTGLEPTQLNSIQFVLESRRESQILSNLLGDQQRSKSLSSSDNGAAPDVFNPASQTQKIALKNSTSNIMASNRSINVQ